MAAATDGGMDSLSKKTVEHLENDLEKHDSTILGILVAVAIGIISIFLLWIFYGKQTKKQAILLTGICDAEGGGRQFLLCAIYPFVEFSEESLYRLFVSYFEVDTNKTGYINYDQYNSVELWTDEETIKQNAGYGFDRSKKLKKVFFDLFSEADSDPRLLDYEKMLLYFCATYSVTNGFIRALSLASLAHMMKSGEPLDITGNQLPINIPEKSEQAKSPLESHKSKLLLTSQESEELAASVTPSQVAESSQSIFEQNYIKTALDQMIPIEALFKVLHHGEVTDGRFHRMNENCDPVDVASMERLVSAYIELGSKDAGPLHYAVLIEHPLIQDLMHRSQFLLMDIKSMLSASANTDADNSRKWK